ncbi:MAG: Ig-like domain-containing protein [Acidobacteria bacterium]|nr:Ig-like domain-containing protein [Acidobacteriota bacterium]
MPLTKRVLLAALCFALAAGSLDARAIFVMPGSGGQTINVFGSDPLGTPSIVPLSGGAFLTLARPDGARYYVISKSGTDTLVILDGSYNVLSRRSLGDEPRRAVLTPDGRKLLILLSATLRVFDTETGNEIVPPASPDLGATVLDVAVSHDSRRAFVLSPAAQRVIAVDLVSPTLPTVGSVFLGGGEYSALSMGPNGFLYVSLQNQVVVVDPASISRVDPVLGVNGLPARLSFSPDGLRAIAANKQTVTGTSAFVFDLPNRSVSTIPNVAQTLEDIRVAGNNRVFALSNGQSLYEISLSPASITQANFAGLGLMTGVTGIALSNELPAARFLYVAAASGVNRVDLTANSEAGRVVLGTLTGGVSFVAPASPGPAVSGLTYNNSQNVLPGATLAPLVARFLDVNGKPVAGAQVNFSTTTPEVGITQTGALTNQEGFIQASAVAPSAPGTYTINAVAGAASVKFSFIVSTGGGSGGTVTPGGGGIFIFSGNGQLVAEQAAASEPLVVKVTNPDGTPAVNQQVTFEIMQGQLSLSQAVEYNCQGQLCFTNSDGKVGIGFTTSSISAGSSFSQAIVKASLASGISVPFNIVVYLRFLSDGTPALEPQISILAPLPEQVLTGAVGTTMQGAIQVRIVAGGRLEIGMPIPNVNLTATSGLDPKEGPTVSCQPNALSDATGLVTCDLTFGGRLGQSDIVVNVGGARSFRRVVQVTAGPPSQVRIVQGNNQSGNPGQKLPLPVYIEVSDSAGNVLAGVPVSWEIAQPGTLTLTNARTITDASGRALAEVTLGQTPGVLALRAKAGSASATFNFTVNVRITSLAKTGGDNQLATVGQVFAQPLGVQVLDDQNRPVPGVQVAFSTLSGSAAINPATVTTDANGRAAVSVTAGPLAGAIQIRATVGSLSQTFNLNSRLPGPVLAAGDFRNAASNQPGLTPGGIGIMRGSGIAPGNQGLLVSSLTPGRLPTQVNGLEIQFGGVSAPIFWVNSQGGFDEVAFQLPFEIPAGPASVFVRSMGGGSNTIPNVQVLPIQPGLFESVSGGQRFAAATRPDGSFVGPDNPALRGEIIRFYATGLGQTTPGTGTNRAGVGGQAVLAPLVAGINNEGVRIVSAEYMPGLIGIYVIAVEVPATTTAGPAQPVAIAADGPDGKQVYSNGSQIPIR